MRIDPIEAEEARVAPPSRTQWLLLSVTLAANAIILAQVAIDLLNAEVPLTYRPRDFVVATLVCIAIFWTLLTLRRRHAKQLLALTGPLVATALLTPAVVLTVSLIMLSAFVLGEALLLGNDSRRSKETPRPPPTICILAGLSVWIGLMAATAAMKIHYAAVYAIAALAPLLVLPKRTATALRRVGSILTEPGEPSPTTERAWLTLLLTLLVLHLLVVAKPEVGYDAGTMHLQFGLLLAKHHRWSFEVSRYVWAVMPLGADWSFAGAYMLGGEGAARLANLVFAAIAGCLVYDLARRHAGREPALAIVCLIVSMPLAFLITASLLVEPLWIAFLLGTLLLTMNYIRNPSPGTLCGIAVLAGGAMQCKALTLFWLVPLLVPTVFVFCRERGWRGVDFRAWMLILAGTIIGAWPYANAWVRTGNPIFPYLNALFRSPYFDSATSFYNPLYIESLVPWSLYDMVLASNRFIEGYDGAIGLHWLLLLPIIVIAFGRRRALEQWLCLALTVVFLAGVYTQQSYLRYLFPAMVLGMIVGGWALNDFVASSGGRIVLFVAAGALCLFDIRFMYAAHVANSMLCPACAFDPAARDTYVATFAPDRTVAKYLNANFPDARIGFFVLNGPSPSGYVGYSRASNWHDVRFFPAVSSAASTDDLLAVARRYRLTHAVFDMADTPGAAVIAAFRERCTVPIWQSAGRTVAVIRTGQ
jgi:4-amino-4-deoxy-L-arabinose transferase-like glycosyltransferase